MLWYPFWVSALPRRRSRSVIEQVSLALRRGIGWICSRWAGISASHLIKMPKPNPLVAEIEHALMPGRFIRYDEMSGFVHDLEGVHERIERLSSRATESVLHLYEVFLSGCYEKIEECDDSNAYLSMFFHNPKS